MRKIDLKHEETRIIDFIRFYVTQAGKKSVILGLSGGLDSAVTAALAIEALGSNNVRAIILPYRTSNHKNVEDAIDLAERLMLQHRVITITPYVDTYYAENAPEASTLRRGNFMARIRMSILYDLSAEYNALVIGTGNRTELLTGYTTQFGDNACAFEPIGHLYKTEVRKFAGNLNIGERIIDKDPSADLWHGQTDEEELGLSYEKLDAILYLLTEKKLAPGEIKEQGYSEHDVDRVTYLYKKSAFKRRMPLLINDFQAENEELITS